jgi:hypothetical protein
VKFLVLYNVIELTYDDDRGKVCKTEDHGWRQFDKLYILSYAKTLDYSYFNKIFSNEPSNKNLDVLDKQQYYISYCHKVCEECLDILHLKCPSHIRCPICEVKQQIIYVVYT